MALLIGPLRPPFFIDEYRTEAKGLEDFAQNRPIFDHSLSFHAILVRAFLRLPAGDALVGDHPFAAILANAQDLPRVAQTAVGSVVKCVPLQGAGGDPRETKCRQLALQGLTVQHTYLYFCFHGLHRPESIPAKGGGRGKMTTGDGEKNTAASR